MATATVTVQSTGYPAMERSAGRPKRKLIWTGRVLSALTGLLMFASGINLMFVRTPDVVQSMAKFGLPTGILMPIGLAALIGSLLYLIPRTAVLGALVLTAYLGGAVATHARIEDPVLVVPMVVGLLIWIGL